MRQLLVLILLTLMTACTASGPPSEPLRNLQIAITPADSAADETFTVSYSFEGGVAPFRLETSFSHPVLRADNFPSVGDGTHPERSYQERYWPINDSLSPKDATFYVVVTDRRGATLSGSAQVTFRGQPAQSPSIVQLTPGAVDVARGTRALDVTLSGTPGLSATVLLTLPEVVNAEPAGRNVIFNAAGTARAEFTLKRLDAAAGAVNVGVIVDGPLPVNGHAEQSIELELPQMALESDTLYALPLKTTVRVGEAVRIVVASGPTAHPFEAGGATVVIPVPRDDLTHVQVLYETLDYGAPGGGEEVADGIWGQVAGNTSVYKPGISEIQEYTFGDAESGAEAKAIQCFPYIYGRDPIAGAQGALFNFEVTFAKPGDYPLLFQLGEQRPSYPGDAIHPLRTHYTLSSDNRHGWTDISNDHPGIPNSVTVLP
jgi:hypothetical protein